MKRILTIVSNRINGTLWGEPSPFAYKTYVEFDTEENFYKVNKMKDVVGPLLDDLPNFSSKPPHICLVGEELGGKKW